uniref:EamA domain-containing protein n=1 Tax=Syphacia muris TaxID=451379 RepID=A0A0N5AF61_9BILA
MFFAILAGTCAALAAASVKLAFSSNSCKVFTLFGLFGYIFFNVLMWWAHVRNLKESSSTFKVTAVNTGVNFFFTSLFGALFFGEVHSMLWWFGIMVLAAGTVLIISSCDLKEKSD